MKYPAASIIAAFRDYTLQEETPRFPTVSYHFRHRFTPETVERIFTWILEKVVESGDLSTRAVFIDVTHIQANANAQKQVEA